MPEHTDLQQQVIDKCHECVDTYNRNFPDKPYLRPLTVEFKLRGRTAGRAWSNRGLVQINNHLLKTETEDMINDTVPHEMAHILANNLHRRDCGHGPRWEWMCNLLGLNNPKRYHNYKSVVRGRAGGANITYVCDLLNCSNPIHKVSQAKHNRIQRGSIYTCTECGARIVRRKPKTSRLAQLAKNS